MNAQIPGAPLIFPASGPGPGPATYLYQQASVEVAIDIYEPSEKNRLVPDSRPISRMILGFGRPAHALFERLTRDSKFFVELNTQEELVLSPALPAGAAAPAQEFLWIPRRSLDYVQEIHFADSGFEACSILCTDCGCDADDDDDDKDNGAQG